MDSSSQNPFIRFLQRVRRSRKDRLLGGICGGFAAHSEIPAWCYRVGFIALSAISVGIFAYIALWIFMPVETPSNGEPPMPA